MSSGEEYITACARYAEQLRYAVAYDSPGYRCQGSRLDNARADLSAIPVRTSYLDVSCGRGEMLDYARKIGFEHVIGTEVVEALLNKDVFYAQAHDLPFTDKCVDVASCFDVIEHLIPGDDEALCRELLRVARKHILITANNAPSCMATGEDLHINKRPYKEWDALFREWFAPGAVTWIPTNHTHETERWRVDL